jgi:2-oxoglutarate ferredoxin oxidoreductase subunit beta
VELHDGSKILLKKLDQGHDPTDRYAALNLLEDAREKQLFITGLIYVNTERPSLAEHENLNGLPLARMPESRLRPSRESLQKIMSAMA